MTALLVDSAQARTLAPSWGWYDKQGNTVPKNKLTGVASDITTVVAIPVSAPFALSDVLSSDTFELLMKIGGK